VPIREQHEPGGAEAFQVDRNGDLHVSIDAGTRGCALSWQPSYRFVKRKDGSVYY